jgi:hypothetical protein
MGRVKILFRTSRACCAVARKLLKRSYHLLRNLGDQALEPVTT